MAGKRGHRGFGHIRKLPSKRYQASYIGPDGSRHLASDTFTTRQDAEGWLAAESRLTTSDDWRSPASRTATRFASRIVLAEYANTWLTQRTLKPRTVALYRDLLQVRSVWGDARELRRAAELLGAELRDAGLEVEFKDSGTPGMPMLVGRLPGPPAGPST